MTIDKNLKWREQADRLDTTAKKILLALSSKKWLWRTVPNLLSVTQLDYQTLTDELAELIENGLVKGSVNRRTGEPIFGLVERVGVSKARRRST